MPCKTVGTPLRLATYRRLLDRSPDSDRANYLLGMCEKARGRTREADTVWARIPPDAPFGSRAVSSRMDLLIERGGWPTPSN